MSGGLFQGFENTISPVHNNTMKEKSHSQINVSG
jgi:hypothetical protein